MRLHFTLSLITVLLLVLTLRANHKHGFTFAMVEDMAQKRSMARYVPMPEVLPPQLQKLTPQQEQGIFWKDTNRLWRKKGLPFQVDFYHPLKSNPQPHTAPLINTADRKGAHLLPYSPAFFNFNNLTFDPPLPTNLGYAGFYVRYPDMAIHSKPTSLDGFFSILGGSYFRVLAKEQVYGLSARGLALNTEVDNKKEEFPNFCEWWLHEPAPNATELVLDALLDSPSVSGAYEFKVRPGGVTSVDIHAVLFFRQDVDRVGIAPFSSMYLYGENGKDHFGDNVHPEKHDSDGVLLHNGKGDWVWRPLQQRPDHQIYNFIDENPKGFGLVQRDRDFQHYQDLDLQYNVRPSAWVTPHGDWGKGAVQLIQLPSNNTDTDNVILLWHADQPIKAGQRLVLDYTIDFYMNDAQLPPLAYNKATFINCPAPPPPVAPASAAPPPAGTKATSTPSPAVAAPAKAGTPPAPAPSPPAPLTPPPTGTVPVQFLVDFAGNSIENIPANAPPDLDLVCNPPGTYVRETKVEKNGYDNSWRATFTIIPAKPHVPTELLCRLKSKEKPLTETWSYTWHQ